MEAAKTINQRYIAAEKEVCGGGGEGFSHLLVSCWPQERERGIKVDQKAAVERAKALDETAQFQVMQWVAHDMSIPITCVVWGVCAMNRITEKQRQRTLEREAAYAEQKKIEKEVVRE